MLLKEMFSPVGAPKDEQADVDWLGDLKFYMDNDNDMLNKHFFPAVKRHKKHQGHPAAYKIYIRPIESCLESYCDKYEIEDHEEKFPKEKLIELAKKIAEQQEKFLERGDYDK
jgi:hypothetical protein